MKKDTLIALAILSGTMVSPDTLLAQHKRLNVLLFTADDLDRNSLGCYGSKVPGISPNIDRFSSEGVMFKNAYVNAAICAPSRAIIATGLYGHNNSVMGFMKMKEGCNVPLIMEILRKNDFKVGVLSKVSHSTPKKEFIWDYTIEREKLGLGRSPTMYYKYSKAFFKDCIAADKPFYLMVNSEDPHRPYQSPNDPLKDGIEAPSRYYSPEEVQVPDFVPDLPMVRQELSCYFNSVKRLDDTFGKVMQALEESGLKENTLVIFISDNGIAIPFAKSNVYYASNRTPWIVRWPGIVKPGSVDEKHHISEVEFMPTILEALGIKPPGKLDGMSHLALYKGEERNASNLIYTQIDNKISGGPTPMRSIQNSDFVYIYNAWCDGERVFVNNAEGLTMRAMEIAAKTDKTIAERVKMFRMRIPEEYYNRNTDPGCKLNLINNPAYAKEIKSAQNNMIILMKKSGDPLLKMFQKRYDSPDVIRKLFYEVFPRAEKYDVKKSAYSKKMDSDNTENE